MAANLLQSRLLDELAERVVRQQQDNDARLFGCERFRDPVSSWHERAGPVDGAKHLAEGQSKITCQAVIEGESGADREHRVALADRTDAFPVIKQQIGAFGGAVRDGYLERAVRM